MSVLDISHLSYQYHHDTPIIFHDFNMQIKQDDFVVLTGSSGSGKTTLIKMILGQIWRYDGTISFQDQIIKHMSKHEIQAMRRQMTCVFQDYKLVAHHTIQENITLPLSISHMSRADIQSRYDHVCRMLQLKWDHGQTVMSLSGGEKQKVAIARSLITAPKIFMADEPTGNLDQKNGRLIADLMIKVYQQQIPVLLITHDMGLLDYLASQISLTHISI